MPLPFWHYHPIMGISQSLSPPREIPSAASGQTTARYWRALTGDIGAGSCPATDCSQPDVAAKRRTARKSANRSHGPGLIWLSPLFVRPQYRERPSMTTWRESLWHSLDRVIRGHRPLSCPKWY